MELIFSTSHTLLFLSMHRRCKGLAYCWRECEELCNGPTRTNTLIQDKANELSKIGCTGMIRLWIIR